MASLGSADSEPSSMFSAPSTRAHSAATSVAAARRASMSSPVMSMEMPLPAIALMSMVLSLAEKITRSPSAHWAAAAVRSATMSALVRPSCGATSR